MNRPPQLSRRLIFVALLGLTPVSSVPVRAQEKQSPGIVTFTTKDDHQNMLQQIGVTSLRPGPSGNENAPDHANFDEALANPFPELPEVLVCNGFGFGGRGGKSPLAFRLPGPSPQQILAKAGWGYALLNPTSVQPDNGAGLTRGIIGLTNLGQPRKPDDWGSLRAWGWGYGAAEAEFGSRNAGDIPVDAHQLIALCAPRLVFISYGVPEKGDAKWLDQQGSYMATVAAQPAYRLFGAETLGVSDDYAHEKMPAVNVGLLSGSLAWRQHDGGHTSGPNLPLFVEWASQKFPASIPLPGNE